MTTAHCLRGDFDSIVVGYGSYSRSTLTEVKAKIWTENPRYVPNRKNHVDLGVVVLENPVQLQNGVEAMYPYNWGTRTAPFDVDLNILICGWGMTEKRRGVQNLKESLRFSA